MMTDVCMFVRMYAISVSEQDLRQLRRTGYGGAVFSAYRDDVFQANPRTIQERFGCHATADL